MSEALKSSLPGTLAILLLLAPPLLMSASSWAALGGASALSASRQLTSGNGYSVQEGASGGTRVREYILDDGTVFAVSWEGLAQPDLKSLLGPYYGEYQGAAARASGYREGVRVFRSNRLVVERSGHMRDVRGIAYAPALLPAGFRLEQLR